MKNKLCIVLLLLFVLTAGLASAQTQPPKWGGIRLNGVVVYAATFASGGATAEGVTRVLNVSEDTLEMTLISETLGLVTGYGLQVEPLEQATKLQVSIKPLSEETIRNMRDSIWVKRLIAKWPGKAVADLLPLPRYPAPQVINLTDTLKLNLWVNAGTGATIGDQLSFMLDQPAPARDFTLDSVMLRLTDFRLFINGEVRSGERGLGGFSGSLPWVYVPGKGRFIFSIQPHTGYNFQKVGLIEHNKLSFNYDGESYEWVSREPILGPGGKWHLWVLHDGGFKEAPGALADANLVSKGNCCLYGALGSPALLPGANK